MKIREEKKLHIEILKRFIRRFLAKNLSRIDRFSLKNHKKEKKKIPLSGKLIILIMDTSSNTSGFLNYSQSFFKTLHPASPRPSN